ncbi:MAG: His Kinase A (phosphoacceptor) domain [Phormidesmis priestleyi Ana]|uniref:histidine kinase n=1 Tax=Phormidesmis priestleyi Ana TaxID=1666911 RepID=A0A0N8KMS0_9CYAN|nr:MAG: His Kinase A (phosphoacceptor) domain [Phormidesmis priestleyi Ana]
MARTSHEMRSPVNTIVSLHQLILEDLCESPEEQREFIQQSKMAALKMLALFDRIAAVSKLDVGRESPQLEPVDLSFLLPEVEMNISLQAANQNVRLTVDSPSDELEIYTDAKWLQNILISLIQDAIPHTKTLKLTAQTKEQSVVITIESDSHAASGKDRSAAALRAELENVANAADTNAADTNAADTNAAEGLAARVSDSDADSTQDKGISPKLAASQFIENIQLSTGLILTTAEIALPLIKGEFVIEPNPDVAERTCLKFVFPSLVPNP